MIDNLKHDLEAIASFSKVNKEIWRASYTKEDQLAKEYLEKLMTDKGMTINYDHVGNLYGLFSGRNTQETLLIGSHLDTVKNGGIYDGLYGVLAGIYACELAVKKFGPPLINLSVIGFNEEEGSRYNTGYIGSRALVGDLTEEHLKECDSNGISLGDAIIKAGYRANIENNEIRDHIKSYYEIHIEQGPFLEKSHLDIGLVKSITGFKVFEITIMGRQDHAGTTPMTMRDDALVAACKIISNFENLVKEKLDEFTVTVGQMKVEPGSSNVVPNLVKFSVDLRSSSKEIIEDVYQKIMDQVNSLRNKGSKINVDIFIDEDPIALDGKLLSENEDILKTLNLTYSKMNSGAGHDAQIIAPYIPTALIFIPCKDGRSHTPDEFVYDKDLMNGINTLVEIIRTHAY